MVKSDAVITNASIEIANSKVFRRLLGKTQIFSPKENDNYRTRITHTIEVYLTSRKIADKLLQENAVDEIDFELLDTISLCHDLGHTPFGHEGERSLHAILSGNDNLGGVIPPLEGTNNQSLKASFKHNIYSGKIYLSKFRHCRNKTKSPTLELQFDYYAVDGIIKHTSLFHENETNVRIFSGLDGIIREFEPLMKEGKDSYYADEDPETKEGQIVAVADEICQRCSDLEDSLTANLIRFDDYLDKMKEVLGNDHSDLLPKAGKMDKWINNLRKTLISLVFMNKRSKRVSLRKRGKALNDACKDVIRSLVHKAYKVRQSDGIGNLMIRKMFEAYYCNPRLLDNSRLISVYWDFKKSINLLKQITKIDIKEESDKKIPNEKLDDFAKDLKRLVDKVNNAIKNGNESVNSANRLAYQIYMLNIAYHIADMTDAYLIRQYEKLFLAN